MSHRLSESLEIVARTHPGRVRSHNEDSMHADAASGLAVIADGMGGYNAGEVAAGLATMMLRTELAKAFADRSPDERMSDGRSWAQVALEDLVSRANGAILQAAQSQARYTGMGTTLVATLFHDNKVTVAHIGDSRLYRWRDGELAQVTRDHSLLQEQVDSGIITEEQARRSQNRNLVTKALGVDPVVEAEIRDHEAKVGDIYLLCSDGLNDMVEDERIGLCLAKMRANLDRCAQQLVDMANESGGRDNVSVILVRVARPFPAARGWWARLLAWFR